MIQFLKAQVVGQKRIFLTPPGHSSAMYPFSSSTEPESATAHLLANTSHVPIFTPDDRPPDRDRFPRFYAEALGDSLEGVLEEGDMLVMPFVHFPLPFESCILYLTFFFLDEVDRAGGMR